MPGVVIPANQQRPGQRMGGVWVVLQAWPLANLWTIALLGPEGMKVTGGYGEWNVVPVPHEVGITEWRGRRNYEATLDILFDGWKTHVVPPIQPSNIFHPPNLGPGVRYASGVQGTWVESWITNLEALAIKQPGDAAAAAKK